MPIALSASSKAAHAQTRPLLRSAEHEGHPPEILEQGPMVSAVKKLEFGFAAVVVVALTLVAFGSAVPTRGGGSTIAGVWLNDSGKTADGVVKVAYAAKLDDYLSVGP